LDLKFGNLGTTGCSQAGHFAVEINTLKFGCEVFVWIDSGHVSFLSELFRDYIEERVAQDYLATLFVQQN
jgi:hypothetical protein